MSKSVQIFDWKSEPFGFLSNNYNHSMFFSQTRKQYASVNQYIYENMLTEHSSKQELRRIKKNIENAFLEKRKMEINNVIRKAIQIALKTKFTQDDELRSELINTGNARLYYLSNDPFLGASAGHESKNWYGIYLEQIRNELISDLKKKKKETDEKEKNMIFYHIYLASIALKNAIQKDKDDLKRFLKMPITDILSILGTPKDALNIEELLANKKKDMYKDIELFIDNTDNLVPSIRKKYIAELRLAKKTDRKKIIFDTYTDFFIKQEYPLLDKEKAKKVKSQTFSSMNFLNQSDLLETKLYKVFKQNKLPEKVMTAIHQKLEHYTIPSKKEVEEATNEVITFSSKSVEPTQYNKLSISKIYILQTENMSAEDIEKYKSYMKYVKFSPLHNEKKMLVIGNIPFLRVSNYIIASVIAYESKMSIEMAHSYLLKQAKKISELVPQDFLDTDKATANYLKVSEESSEKYLIQYCKEGLDKKFEDRIAQDFLLATGNKHIIYNDFTNPILGIGNNHKGKNIVGKYLVDIRAKLIKQRQTEKIHLIRTEDITELFKTNSFMKNWAELRVRECCNVLQIMKKYIKRKFNSEINEFNSAFTISVLDNIYQSCSKIYGASKQVTSKAPDYFIQWAKKYCDTIKNDAIEVIWKRTVIVIYYLVQSIDASNRSDITITSEIAKAQTYSSAVIEKCEDLGLSKYDNCIISALVNLLSGIIKFNTNISVTYEITEEDVRIAVSIILNSFVIELDSISETMEKEDKEYDLPVDLGELPDIEHPELVFDEIDDLNEQRDLEGEIDESNDYGDEYDESPLTDIIETVISDIPEIKDKEAIGIAIEKAVKTIKKWRMPIERKRNRINFFATQIR
jgi:predicted NAD-dependent protein-ADP-ribosyltransferase YbiA (DUF1768 family)